MSQTRLCGGHCPIENIKETTDCYCRICKQTFHMPCYDLIGRRDRLFITPNVVFICDSCLIELDNSSPKRKSNKSGTPVNSSKVRQTLLTPNSDGKFSFVPHPNFTESRSSQSSNISNISKLSKLINELKAQIDNNTNQLDKNTTAVNKLKDSVDVNSSVQQNIKTSEKKTTNDFAGGRVPSKKTFASILTKSNTSQMLNAQQNTPTTSYTKSTFRPKLNADRSATRTKTEDANVKLAMKNRQLISGTGSPVNDILGNGVNLPDKREPKPRIDFLF